MSINTHFCCSFLRDVFFLCVRTSKHDFQLGLLITPLCSRVWIHERDTFYFEFPHSGTFFFIVARIFRQSFSFHIGILKGSSFFLGLALECWCEQPFTFPFILYCLIVSLFCVSFNFSAFLWIWKCRRPVYWSFEFFFDVSKKKFLSGNFSLGNLVNWFFQHIVKLPEFSYWVQPLSGKFVCSTSRINSIGGSMFSTI